MADFDQEAFNNFVLDNGVIRFSGQELTLSSGRQTNWYVNWRRVVEDAHTLDQLTTFIIEFTRHLMISPDFFYGVPEGATPIGLATQLKWAQESLRYGKGSHPVVIGRGQFKTHGEPIDRLFIGTPRGKFVVLEDVTTTGESTFNALSNFERFPEVTLLAVYSLTNRMQRRANGLTVEEEFDRRGIRYFALSKATDLLPEAYRHQKPGEDIAEAVEREFAELGAEPIKLR